MMQRPFKATSSRAAGLFSLPPDTPLNLVASIARKRRAINELRQIQADYVAGAPVARRQRAPLPAQKGIVKKSQE